MRNVSVTAFKKLTQEALATFAINVVSLMSNDPQFASLSAAITDLKNCSDAYSTALTNSVNGGRLLIIEKNKCKKALLNQLSDTAFFVDVLAKGEESIILAAGFSVRKPNSSYTSLEAPLVLKLDNDIKKGVVNVQLEKVEGATVYGIEKCIVTPGEPDGPWMNGDYTSALKFQMTGLESGKTYLFRFRAIGFKGLVSAFSDVESLEVW